MALPEQETPKRPIRITIAKHHARLRTLIGTPGEWQPTQPNRQSNKEHQAPLQPQLKPTAK